MRHYLNYLIFFTLPFLSPLLLMSQNNTERKITTLSGEEQELYLRDTIKYKFIVDAVNGNAEAMVELGSIFYDKNDFSKAFKWYTKAAELGNSDAMNNLGILYENGQGVEKSYHKAFEWYTKAADLGNDWALKNTGDLYKNGQGVDKDFTKAIEWYTKAAESGNSEAMNNLGYLYNFGQGVEKSYPKAIEWYTKAAELGNSLAMNNIGILYENGQGVEKSYSKAIEWYSKAADLGNDWGLKNIGDLYKNGQGVEKDSTKAIEWYTKAAELGNLYAISNLIILYEYVQVVEKNYSKVNEWYEKAAKSGNYTDIDILGDIFYYGNGVEKDYAKAKEWYEKAAELGNSTAMEKLGDIFYFDRGVEQDYTKAKEWYEKAADLGSSYGMEQLGDIFNLGYGVEKDYIKVKTWYEKAAELGNVDAMISLGTFYRRTKNTDLEKSIYWYLQAAKSKKYVYSFIGEIYAENKKNRKAVQYYLLSEDYLEIALLYEKENKIDSALFYFKKEASKKSRSSFDSNPSIFAIFGYGLYGQKPNISFASKNAGFWGKDITNRNEQQQYIITGLYDRGLFSDIYKYCRSIENQDEVTPNAYKALAVLHLMGKATEKDNELAKKYWKKYLSNTIFDDNVLLFIDFNHNDFFPDDISNDTLLYYLNNNYEISKAKKVLDYTSAIKKERTKELEWKEEKISTIVNYTMNKNNKENIENYALTLYNSKNPKHMERAIELMSVTSKKPKKELIKLNKQRIKKLKNVFTKQK